MIRWDYPPRCLSPHVSPPRSHCEALSWNAPPREGERTRLITWTCDCGPVLFELHQAGGLRFIRRTARGQGGVSIAESDRWPAREADAMWNALLCGLVR